MFEFIKLFFALIFSSEVVKDIKKMNDRTNFYEQQKMNAENPLHVPTEQELEQEHMEKNAGIWKDFNSLK